MTNDSKFTPAQDAFIASYIPTFANLTKIGSPRLVRKWKAATVTTIQSSPLFEGLLPTADQNAVRGADQTTWSSRLDKKLSNGLGKDKRHSEKPGFLVFSPLSGYTIFGKEAKAAILAKMQDCDAKELTYEACQQQMWQSLPEDVQDEYDIKAAETPASVETNQADFVNAASSALGRLCRGGQVGHLEIKMFWAFRNIGGDLEHGVINSHGVDNIADMAEGEFLDIWKTFSEKTIPCPQLELAVGDQISISRNSHGVPVFPEVEIRKLSPEKMGQILESYLTELWQHAWPGYTTPPWAEMGENPETYYDHSRYKLPVKLNDPTLMPIPELCQIAQFFLATSSALSGDPFKFSRTTFQLTPNHSSNSRDSSPSSTQGLEGIFQKASSLEEVSEGYEGEVSNEHEQEIAPKSKVRQKAGKKRKGEIQQVGQPAGKSRKIQDPCTNPVDSIATRRSSRQPQPKRILAKIGGAGEVKKPGYYIGVFVGDKQVGILD
ncbi:hypothetical protein C8R43DRAFT_964107 [Mycena crocata]|nr:hypothetical protein C8R43DRAFT_964107 [Mycena crocata]